MTIKLETNIPMPENAKANSGIAIYPFAEMEVGHSFFAEGKSVSQMNNAAGHWRKKNGWKFLTEASFDENGGLLGTRVWRRE